MTEIETTPESLPFLQGFKCSFCGQRYWAKRCDSKFCSATCRGKFYRWRKKLEKYHEKVIAGVTEIADYVRFENSRPAAVACLNDVIQHVRKLFNEVGVRVVK